MHMANCRIHSQISQMCQMPGIVNRTELHRMPAVSMLGLNPCGLPGIVCWKQVIRS